MFGISWNEYLLIAVVALVVIGPKDLPRVLRAVGQWTAKVRRMAAEFQGQFQEALREAEMADLKKEVDSIHSDIHDAARGFTSQFNDPLNLQDATKWEPKPDLAPEAGKPVDAGAVGAVEGPDGTRSDGAPAPADGAPVSSTPVSSTPGHAAAEEVAAGPAEPAAEMAGVSGAAPAPAAAEGSGATGEGADRP